MIMQKRKGGDLGQNGGNGMVNSGQPLALGPAGFTLDQMWSVRKKKRAKNYLNNWKIGVPQVRGSIRGSFQHVKFDAFVIHLGKDVSRQLDIWVMNLGQSSGCRFIFPHPCSKGVVYQKYIGKLSFYKWHTSRRFMVSSPSHLRPRSSWHVYR